MFCRVSRLFYVFVVSVRCFIYILRAFCVRGRTHRAYCRIIKAFYKLPYPKSFSRIPRFFLRFVLSLGVLVVRLGCFALVVRLGCFMCCRIPLGVLCSL